MNYLNPNINKSNTLYRNNGGYINPYNNGGMLSGKQSKIQTFGGTKGLDIPSRKIRRTYNSPVPAEHSFTTESEHERILQNKGGETSSQTTLNIHGTGSSPMTVRKPWWQRMITPNRNVMNLDLRKKRHWKELHRMAKFTGYENIDDFMFDKGFTKQSGQWIPPKYETTDINMTSNVDPTGKETVSSHTVISNPNKVISGMRYGGRVNPYRFGGRTNPYRYK